MTVEHAARLPLDVPGAAPAVPEAEGRARAFLLTAGGAAVPAMAVGTVAVVLTHFNLWRLSAVPIMSTGYFEDLRQVTATADCLRSNPGWTPFTSTCDPFGRFYNYSTIWARSFAAVGLGLERTSLVGYGFILLFALAVFALAVLVLRPRPSWRKVLVLMGCAVSPPSLFALERGNIDVVVFALVVAGVVLVAARWSGSAAVLLAAAAVLKLFPLGALPVLLLGRRRLEPFALAGLVLAIGAIALAPELPSILAYSPTQSFQSFGVAVLPISWVGGDPAGVAAARRIGLVLFVLGVLALAALRLLLAARWVAWHIAVVDALHADRPAAAAFVGGGGAVLCAYLVGSSWDYRLIFLLPVIAGLLRVAGLRTRAAWAAAAVLGAQLYLTYPLSGPTPDRPGAELWFAPVWLATAPYIAILALEVCLRPIGPVVTALRERRGRSALRSAEPVS